MLGLLHPGGYLNPGHGCLMHGENPVDFKIGALHRLRNFMHELGIVQAGILVESESVAGIEQARCPEVGQILASGGCAP